MKNISVLFLLAISITSCTYKAPKSTLIIDVALADTSKGQTISIVDKEAIKKRLQNSGVEITVDILTRTTARIKLKTSKPEETITPLFQHVGEFAIYEAVLPQEIAPAITSIYNEEANADDTTNTFKKVFNLTSNNNQGYIGVSQIKDTAIVNTFFKGSVVQEYLQKNQLNVVFKWSIPSKPSDLLKLYALKLNNLDKPAMYGDFIEDSRQQFNHMGKPSINFKMKELPAKKWSELTKRAAQERFPLPIVLDNQVYVAPMVMQEIKGGLCEISGDFTVESASIIAQVLASDPIPKLEIKKIDFLKEKE